MGSPHRSYSYDSVNNLVEVLDSNWGPTKFEYDAGGHVAALTCPLLTERFVYDHLDNVTANARENHDKPSRLPARVPIHGDMKPDRLVARDDVHYEYNPSGQLVRKNAGGTETRYLWRRS